MILGYVHSARDGDLGRNNLFRSWPHLGGLLLCEAGQGAGQAMAHDAMVLGIGTGAGPRNLHREPARQPSYRPHRTLGRAMRRGRPRVDPLRQRRERAIGSTFRRNDAAVGNQPLRGRLSAPQGPPIVVDFATSRWAVGKVRVAFNKGEEVPPGTLLDAAGQPTLDASALFGVPSGALVGFGEHKGFGLSLACELLAGALPGAKTQTGPRSSPATFNSMFSVIVSPERLGTAGPFKERLEAVLDWLRSENGNGTASILAPGEPEVSPRCERRLREGIPVDAETLRQLSIAAEEAGSPERP